MQELLDFIQASIESETMIGMRAVNQPSGGTSYVVDYWGVETTIDDRGEEVEIKAGKQKVFTL